MDNINKFWLIGVLFVLLFLIGGVFAPAPPVEPTDELVIIEVPVQQPQGPTGFFGLGEATDFGVGIVGILAVLAIIGIIWKKQR